MGLPGHDGQVATAPTNPQASDIRRRLEAVEHWEALAREVDFEPEAMASRSRVSLRQLERIFAVQFQKTPKKWIVELKCRLAQELIAQGYSTKAAAAQLNFANESHFCHEVKKTCGVPPQAFASLCPAFHASQIVSRPSPFPNHVA